MSTMTEKKTTPSAWIGCLQCYNAGALVGEWFEGDEIADVTPRTIHPHLAGPVADTHEEMWVMDHEGFDGLIDGECSPMDAARLFTLHTSLDEQGIPVAAFAQWCSGQGADVEDADALADFEGKYMGEWETPRDWAEDLLEDQLDELPEWAQSHRGAIIDSWLSDADRGGEFSTIDAPQGRVYIFTA